MSKTSRGQPVQGDRVSGQQSRNKVVRDQIIVMGATGAGKSTFINKLIGREGFMKVGTSLRGCTYAVNVANIEHEKSKRSFEVVDTPGFNDGNTDDWPDYKLLDIVATSLKETHNQKSIAAIIYVYDISTNSLNEHERVFEIIKNIGGKQAFGHFVIVTTKWDKCDANGKEDDTRVYEANEITLTKAILKPPFSEEVTNLTLFRFSQSNRNQPVTTVLDYIATTLPQPINELKIQNEMNTKKMPLEKTSAAQFAGIPRQKTFFKRVLQHIFGG